MTKVSAYHSTNPSDPDVYHNQSDCPPGSQIPLRNRASGTGSGNTLCKKCKDMG